MLIHQTHLAPLSAIRRKSTNQRSPEAKSTNERSPDAKSTNQRSPEAESTDQRSPEARHPQRKNGCYYYSSVVTLSPSTYIHHAHLLNASLDPPFFASFFLQHKRRTNKTRHPRYQTEPNALDWGGTQPNPPQPLYPPPLPLPLPPPLNPNLLADWCRRGWAQRTHPHTHTQKKKEKKNRVESNQIKSNRHYHTMIIYAGTVVLPLYYRAVGYAAIILTDPATPWYSCRAISRLLIPLLSAATRPPSLDAAAAAA